MELRHLELLRELSQRGSITAVAAATYRTPSAVSQQLRTAERQSGTRLVEPAGRGVRLTDAGRLLAEGGVEVAESMARVQARLDRLVHAPLGEVSLGTLPSGGEALLPSLLADPALTGIALTITDFDVSEADFARRARDHDIVVGHQPARTPQARQHPTSTWMLAREPLDVAMPADHRLAGDAGVTAAQVGGEPWIGVPVGYPFDAVRLAIEESIGRPMSVVQRLRDNRMVEALVAAGVGLAVLPRFTTRGRSGLVTRPLLDVPAARYLVALTRPDRAERVAVAAVLGALVRAGRRLEVADGEART